MGEISTQFLSKKNRGDDLFLQIADLYFGGMASGSYKNIP
jgi:hypothetical protein